MDYRRCNFGSAQDVQLAKAMLKAAVTGRRAQLYLLATAADIYLIQVHPIGQQISILIAAIPGILRDILLPISVSVRTLIVNKAGCYSFGGYRSA